MNSGDSTPAINVGFSSDARPGPGVVVDRTWSLDDLPIAILVFAGDQVVAINERWTALTGLDLASSQGDGWLTAARRQDRSGLQGLPREASSGNDAVSDWRLAGPDGRGLVSVRAQVHHVVGTAPGACVMTLGEIETTQDADPRLLHLATHDGLTGLLNRATFIALVEDALQREAPHHTLAALLFIDLDRFKEVNDRLGHQAGDLLLSIACRRIRSSLRPTESAGRLGGDEVGVLCPALESRDSAVRLAQRIVTALEEPFTIHDEIVLIGASVGIAFSDDSPSAVSLVNDADRAMYSAKQQGRAQCVVFSSGETAERSVRSASEVETSLAHVAVAVARDERQVNDLWRNSIDLRDKTLAHRLERISHALRAARIALRDDQSIG